MSATVARYPGRCPGCGDEINPGDLLVLVDDEWVHVHCEADALLIADPHTRQAEACPSCYLVRPCPCDDERKTT